MLIEKMNLPLFYTFLVILEAAENAKILFHSSSIFEIYIIILKKYGYVEEGVVQLVQ